MHPLQWLREHDRNYLALRRAARTAIVMPALFALGDKVIDNAEIATFAAFGTFAMLLLVDFTGSMRDRLQAQAALTVTGCAFVCIGTLATRNMWLAAAMTAVVGFGVIFAGVVSSVLAGATTSLLLAFILPVTLAAPASSVPDRLEGWAIAGAAGIVAVGLFWPAPTRDPLRTAASTACRALAARLRSEVASVLSGRDETFEADRDRAVVDSDEAVAALHRVFLATPYRPTGLSTATRTVVRLVDEVNWLNAVIVKSAPPVEPTPVNKAACAVKIAAAGVLEQGAALLDVTGGAAGELRDALQELDDALARMEKHATVELPVQRTAPDRSGQRAEPGRPMAPDERVREFLSSLDPSFRAQELSFAVALIGRNIDLTAAAERRSWPERVLGRQPEGLSGRLSAAQERATAHVERHSVWLHNSVRGAVGLGLAVLVADRTGVQHSFWVVLGTLSVLRSNALNTGQNVLRGILGTTAGFVAGALLLSIIGTNTTVLWFLLPVAVLIAGIAPAAISFAAGQAAFTVTLVILYNIIRPAGWRIGLLRVEDIALGCGISLAVGLLFWPRGAGAALRQALAEAYTDSAAYLAEAVDFGMLRCDGVSPPKPAPTAGAVAAAAAARRLDDTFRGFLAERGTKLVPLAQVTSLVTGVAGLRLAAEAVMDLWQRDDGVAVGDRTAARRELMTTMEQLRVWYADLATSLAGRTPLRDPLPHDRTADGRLVDAVRKDLRGDDGAASATAVRMIWTGDHLDAVRRLQGVIIDPARAANAQRALGPLGAIRPHPVRSGP
jgi:uncharacterized membrane protein YccC